MFAAEDQRFAARWSRSAGGPLAFSPGSELLFAQSADGLVAFEVASGKRRVERASHDTISARHEGGFASGAWRWERTILEDSVTGAPVPMERAELFCWAEKHRRRVSLARRGALAAIEGTPLALYAPPSSRELWSTPELPPATRITIASDGRVLVTHEGGVVVERRRADGARVAKFVFSGVGSPLASSLARENDESLRGAGLGRAARERIFAAAASASSSQATLIQAELAARTEKPGRPFRAVSLATGRGSFGLLRIELAAFSPGASGSFELTLEDAESSEPVASLDGLTIVSGPVALEPSGARLATFHQAGPIAVVLLDLATKTATVIATVESTPTFVGFAGGLVWAMLANRFVAWDADTGAERASIPRTRELLSAVAVSPDGTTSAWLGFDKVHLVPLAADGPPATVIEARGASCVAFRADGVLVGTRDGGVLAALTEPAQGERSPASHAPPSPALEPALLAHAAILDDASAPATRRYEALCELRSRWPGSLGELHARGALRRAPLPTDRLWSNDATARAVLACTVDPHAVDDTLASAGAPRERFEIAALLAVTAAGFDPKRAADLERELRSRVSSEPTELARAGPEPHAAILSLLANTEERRRASRAGLDAALGLGEAPRAHVNAWLHGLGVIADLAHELSEAARDVERPAHARALAWIALGELAPRPNTAPVALALAEVARAVLSASEVPEELGRAARLVALSDALALERAGRWRGAPLDPWAPDLARLAREVSLAELLDTLADAANQEAARVARALELTPLVLERWVGGATNSKHRCAGASATRGRTQGAGRSGSAPSGYTARCFARSGTAARRSSKPSPRPSSRRSTLDTIRRACRARSQRTTERAPVCSRAPRPSPGSVAPDRRAPAGARAPRSGDRSGARARAPPAE
ncbi:MAG: hypothetical protein U0271_36935 [Polyangiaceae bacterium]